MKDNKQKTIELKAAGYDCVAAIENYTQQLQLINQELRKLNEQPVTEPQPEEEETEEPAQ